MQHHPANCLAKGMFGTDCPNCDHALKPYRHCESCGKDMRGLWAGSKSGTKVICMNCNRHGFSFSHTLMDVERALKKKRDERYW